MRIDVFPAPLPVAKQQGEQVLLLDQAQSWWTGLISVCETMIGWNCTLSPWGACVRAWGREKESRGAGKARKATTCPLGNWRDA